MKFGLLGKGISYSLSPHIFETISKHKNMEITYELFDVEETSIKYVIDKLKHGEINGLNVTKPYKETVLQYCDLLSSEAEAIQSVNTLIVENGNVKGYNTDIDGFEKLLEESGFESLKPIYVFGNGGSSKSVAYVLNKKNLDFKIVKRNTSQRDFFHHNEITYHEVGPGQGLVIQTTTVGLDDKDIPLVEEKTLRDKSMIDLIYHVSETKHMKLSKQSINGIDMLIHQALKSFSIWTSLDTSNDVKLINYIKDVLNRELNR